MQKLQRKLKSIHNKGYKAYKSLQGQYEFKSFILYIDHVQGDPFASPSKMRVRIPWEEAGFPIKCIENRVRQMAFEDYIIRQFAKGIRRFSGGIRGTGKSGLISIDRGGQEILKRTAMISNEDFIEIRFEMGLPARGRTISSNIAETMFFEELPAIVQHSMFYKNLNSTELKYHIDCTENFYFIQQQLVENRWVAFIADGSILPRESGISEKPLKSDSVIPFQSPFELRQTIHLKNPLPNGQMMIQGMVIPYGITLIVGGGFHGKSTLLDALKTGIVPHIPGDGREYVVSHPDCVKIKAEEGRCVHQVNICPFINHLPGKIDVTRFSTQNASGSTSQAANILEALESGAKVLLIDEDTSATNFMIRDARMQALVHKDKEPITPLIDRIEELRDQFDVSTVLVMGGNGDFLELADLVIHMEEYKPRVVTEKAKEIANQFQTGRHVEREFAWDFIVHRVPDLKSIHASRGRKEVKIDVRGIGQIIFGSSTIDMTHVEQIFDTSQCRAIAYAIYILQRQFSHDSKTISELLTQLENFLLEKGLEALNPFVREGQHPGHFAWPRRHEIAAALNRIRTLSIINTIEKKY